MTSKEARAAISAIVRAGLTPPRVASIVITNGCNLRCVHCWRESHSLSDSPPVPGRAVRKLIKEFAELGAKQLCITGGEPLTHPEWFEILSFSSSNCSFEELCLQTNGTLLTDSVVSLLRSLPHPNLTVQVSLDGSDASSHDQVRGAGSFDKVLKGLSILTRCGMGAKTRIAFTEMRHNFDELPRLLELLKTMGIGKLVANTLVQGGRALLTDEIAPPTHSQYVRLLERYVSDREFAELYGEIGSAVAIEWYRGRSLRSGSACGLIGNPYVTADGLMYPCAMFQDTRFALTGLHERPLEDILIEAMPLLTELLELHNCRPGELEICQRCNGRLHCGGGCMGRAYAVFGRIMAVEDRCSLRQAVYEWERA